MPNALIVGGAGFIGSHLVDVCLRNDNEVWVYDDFSVGKKAFLLIDPHLNVVEGDILDNEHLLETLRKASPDVVYHLAAIHHIPTCEKAPERALSVNIVGTESLLTACAETPVPRIVFASTGALYDPELRGPLPETAPVKAFDIYSISKLACEHLLAYHSAKNRCMVLAARLFNNVGRRETNSHLIPAIVAQLSSSQRQIRLGNLSPRRDYIHVEDTAEALFMLGSMDAPRRFDVFNVGTGIEHSVQELVELFAEVIGESLEIVSAPELQRKIDRQSQLADLTKIQQISGWEPTRTLRQALYEVWEENIKFAK